MSIRWSLLNDHRFVQLVADLLKRLGFVDVDVQGDGPDGGIDIIATELVSMTFQGARPLRWGIQCKFSKPGGRRAVTDNEIRDVEGILRSKRFENHGLQGYMVVTNRRVSQNVAERLLGIDTSSKYRTSWIDGSKITQYLSEQPELLDSYFGELIRQIEELAEEQARERSAEATGGGEFRMELSTDHHLEGCQDATEIGDISGSFKSLTGLLELEHHAVVKGIFGRYTYHSEDVVAELQGELDRGVISYQFHWLNRDIAGSGFYLVSPDGDRLEGMWLRCDDLSPVTFEYLWQHGNRTSYTRI